MEELQDDVIRISVIVMVGSRMMMMIDDDDDDDDDDMGLSCLTLIHSHEILSQSG